MSRIQMNAPRVITVEYAQDTNDTNYGCCLWARFYFDLDNYSLTIESDCGSYGYSWVRTPSAETFLHLCSRFNYDYLLEKLSRPTVFDSNKVWENMQYLLDSLNASEDLQLYALETYDVVDELKRICFSYTDQREYVDAVEYEIRHTPLDGLMESYDIWETVSHDFPINAKTICKIFVHEIIPWLKQQEELSNDFKQIETI